MLICMVRYLDSMKFDQFHDKPIDCEFKWIWTPYVKDLHVSYVGDLIISEKKITDIILSS